MVNFTTSTARSQQRVSLLTSMQTKLTLMVIAPAVMLGAVAIGAQQYASGISEQAIEGIIHTNKYDSDLAATAKKIQANAGQFKDGLIAFTQRHQQDLLRNRKSAGGEQIVDLRSQAAALSGLVDQDLPSLREVMVGSEEQIATNAEKSAIVEKRYKFVARNARNVSRLLDIFLASHERTVELLAEKSFARARANYIFEENARSLAVEKTVKNLTAVLDDFARDVAGQMASDMDATVADAQHSTASASTLVTWGVVAAVLVCGLLAVLFVSATVNRPMAHMTTAMRRLADGDLEIEIEKDGRRDELGEMAAALDVFRANALATKRLEEEKAANAEREALETKEMRKRHEALGVEIVTLVEKVTSGDFSERLSTEGKSGILAEICGRINDLVDGLDAIVGDVTEKIEALAEGNLDQRVTKDYGGTFATLSANVNRMADQLSGIVGQIQAATTQVKNAAAEISSGTEDLSNRTEQAASSLEETAASTKWRRRSSKTPKAPRTPVSLRATPITAPRPAVTSLSKRSAPWIGSSNPRRRSPTSSRSLMKSPFRPTCLR